MKYLEHPRARICKPFKEPRIDSQSGGRYDNPIRRTGLPGYIGWPNRFFGIDAWAS